MNSILKIKITKTSDGGCLVKVSCGDSDIFKAAIQQLKDSLPAKYRSYDPDTRSWKVAVPSMIDGWLYVLRHYYAVEVEYAHGHSQQSGSQTNYRKITNNHETLFVTEDAPPEVIKASYKALARMFHPDAGGDHQKMVSINQAYTAISRNW